MTEVYTNDDCPLFCSEYSTEIEEGLSELRKTGAENDSLEIKCPDSDCTLVMEKYVKIRSSGNRTIRNGMFPGICKLSPVSDNFDFSEDQTD